MNSQLNVWAFLLAGIVASHADALNRKQVAPDAKWVVHLDCDNLRQSKVGGYMLTNFVTPKADELSGALKFNVSNVLSKVSSLTAFGTDFNTGPDTSAVLLINSDNETQKALEGLLVAQILVNSNGPVSKIEGDNTNLYSFANQVFISPQKGGPIIVSKSEDRIEAIREMFAGKSAPAGAPSSTTPFRVASNSFLFVELADASSIPNAIPAKAKVLQMADAGSVTLGERDDQTFLNLSLRGKTAEVTHQMQQVLEGMVALVSLGQPENQDLADLAKAIKVSAADQLINVSVELPTSRIIAKITDEMSSKPAKEKPAHAKAKVKSKNKKKQEAKQKERAVQAEADNQESAQASSSASSESKPEAAKPQAEESAK